MLPTQRNYARLPNPATWQARKAQYSRGVVRCLQSPRLSLFLALLTLAIVGLVITSGNVDIPLSIDLPFTNSKPDYKIPEAPSYEEDWPKSKRAEAVKEAFLHAYRSYELYAFPKDELRPLSNLTVQNLNGWGLTVFDSLDTLWLMGLEDEFNRATRHVSRTKFQNPGTGSVMFFETVIRYLGGLLSAYALTHRGLFLKKADELGRALLPAFNTTSGMPSFAVDLNSGSSYLGPRFGHAVLAEIGSCQMEFKYLAHLTGKPEYFEAANKTMDLMESSQRENGMWATTWSTKTGEQVDNHITVGALADSAYEYLLKQYLLSGRSEKRLRDMYLKTAEGILHNLLYLTPNRHLLYATDIYASSPPYNPSRRFEHLTCFLPGMFALGAHTLSTPVPGTTIASDLWGEELQMHRWAAEGLARSCWTMYADMPSGLGAEIVQFDYKYPSRSSTTTTATGSEATANPQKVETGLWTEALEQWNKLRYQVSAVTATKGEGFSHSVPPGVYGDVDPLPQGNDTEREYRVVDSRYLLRPETIESIYVQYRTTRQPIWQERAWQIFLAIERHCRKRVGYASMKGVNADGPVVNSGGVAYMGWQNLDEMPSYALAETFKYLYLIFLDHDPLPMDKWVFNTEAHPLPIFEWSEKEKRTYGIS